MTASDSPVLDALYRRMLRDGTYSLSHDELDGFLERKRPGLKAAERDQHFQDLYLQKHLVRSDYRVDRLTLEGYRAVASSGDKDFDQLLAALRRIRPERTGLLVPVRFEDICRDSRYFYPDDLDCKPQWIHSLLVMLGIAPDNTRSEGPWELLSSEVRVAVECETVEEFLKASAASKRREKRFAAERKVQDYAGAAVVDALHDDIAELALERWQTGQFADAVQICLHVVERAVEAKAGVKCSTDVPNLLSTVFSVRKEDFRSDTLGAKECGSVRLHLPAADKTDVTWKNRQDALRHLAMGFQKGIRNPRSHEPSALTEVEALEVLCLASHILHLIDECKVVNLGAVDPTSGTPSGSEP